MDVFETGLSMSAISLNWIRVQEMLAKLDVVVPPGIVDGIRNFKDGAAELLLEELYGHFTGRRIDKLEAARQIDFTDHAYQVQATGLCSRRHSAVTSAQRYLSKG